MPVPTNWEVELNIERLHPMLHVLGEVVQHGPRQTHPCPSCDDRRPQLRRLPWTDAELSHRGRGGGEHNVAVGHLRVHARLYACAVKEVFGCNAKREAELWVDNTGPLTEVHHGVEAGDGIYGDRVVREVVGRCGQNDDDYEVGYKCGYNSDD